MKKLVFSISLILSYTFIAIAGVVKSIPAKADEFTNGNIVTVTPSISETDLTKYNNALQVLEYLRQGGTIDFSNVSDNYTSGDLLDEFVDLIDTVGNGIDYYGNNILDNIFDLSTDTVQLSPNTKLKDRIHQFRSNLPSYLRSQDPNDPGPTPNPDNQYDSYLRRINTPSSDGFFWKYYPQSYNFSGYLYVFQNQISNVTWFCKSNSTLNDISNPNLTYSGQMGCSNQIETVNIYSENGTYHFNQTFYNYNYVNTYFANNGNLASENWLIYNQFNKQTESLYGVGGFNSYTQYNYSGTLGEVLQYVSTKVRNVNLYVDGVLWLEASNSNPNYNIALGTGTYLIETNQPIEYKFDIPVYVDISDLIDKIQLAIDNKITLDFPYLNDLIVDTNGQQTIAVTVFSEEYTLDDLYVKDYGAMIPLFPLWVEYPVALEHINTVATVGIIDVIPADIIEVLGIFLIVGLFVFLCHRLME